MKWLQVWDQTRETETNLLLPSSSSMSSASSEGRPVPVHPRKKKWLKSSQPKPTRRWNKWKWEKSRTKACSNAPNLQVPGQASTEETVGKKKRDTEQRAHWREMQWFHKWIITAAGWQTIWFIQQDHQDFGGFRTGRVSKCCRPSASVFTQRQRQRQK